MSSNGTPPDPDDFFSETRMSFGDHIEDLRTHLWRALKGFGVALLFSFFIGHIVVQFITAPVEELTPDRAREIGQAAHRRVLAQHTYAQRAAQLDEILEGALV